MATPALHELQTKPNHLSVETRSTQMTLARVYFNFNFKLLIQIQLQLQLGILAVRATQAKWPSTLSTPFPTASKS